MRKFWILGDLSLWDLIRRVARESWEDAVFGQGGRMSFYHFLAIFPSLLVFLAICARLPDLGDHLKKALQDLSSQVLPEQVSQLFLKMMEELNDRGLSVMQTISIGAGATWAALNGTLAMIYGLNRAYEVEEHRTRLKLAVTVVGLTVTLGFTGCISVFLTFYGANMQAHFYPGAFGLRVLEWLVLAAMLSLSFVVLYRFAPSLHDHEWRWSVPGALCALILWIGATFLARIYFDHADSYARSYGHLNVVVMFLLWLYVTNGAILIGGEVNSEIGKAVADSLDTSERGGYRRVHSRS